MTAEKELQAFPPQLCSAGAPGLIIHLPPCGTQRLSWCRSVDTIDLSLWAQWELITKWH